MHIFRLIILLLFVEIITNADPCFPQVSQQWLHRYLGPLASTDTPLEFAFDKSGNVFVTGKALIGGGYYKMITVKFNSSGIRKWISVYPGLPNFNYEGSSIKSDSLGNIYVSGNVRTSSGQYDFIVVKYDSSGNVQWTNQYNSPFNLDDLSYSSALDRDGNFYVGGNSNGTGTSTDFLLLKYSTSGNLIWARRWNGASNLDDNLKEITLTPSGNIAVGGYSFAAGASYDFVTLSYDTSGNLAWTKFYNGPQSSADQLSDIFCDASGNVYVCGKSTGTGTGFDYAAIKYNSSGAQQWVSRFNSAGTSDDSPAAISADDSGNVYVTGQSNGLTVYYDFMTIKINTAGTQQWVRYYNGPEGFFDRAVDIMTDNEMNCYVTGNSIKFSDGTSDLIILKYNTAGNLLWTKIYNGPGNLDDIPVKMRKNYQDNIVLISESSGYFLSLLHGSSDYLVLNYNLNGDLLYESRFDGAGSGADISASLFIDTSGNCLSTGYSYNNFTNYDITTLKFNSSGIPLWIANYDGNSGIDVPSGISGDNSGNVFISGSSQGAGTGFDIVTAKYNSSGSEIWSVRYNGSSNGDDLASGITVDAAGNVYTGGYSDSSGSSKDFILLKYNNSGILQWIKKYNGPGNSDDILISMITDSAGSTYVTGKSQGTGTQEDIATIKYNTSGSQIWLSRFNGAANNSDIPSSVTFDVSGNAIVTGKSNTAALSDKYIGSNYDMVTVKYNSSGTQQWAALFNGTGNGDDESNSVATDSEGGIYIAGSFKSNSADYDYSVIKYNPDGTLSWNYSYNGSSNLDDRALSVTADPVGNIYAAGFSRELITGYDYYSVKLNRSGNLKWTRFYNHIDNDTDKATFIKSDLSGNIFVTGYSKGLEGGIDYLTIKYRQDKALDLRILIQGFYNQTSDKMISDTAKIYLRNSASPYLLSDSSKSVLDTSGSSTFYFSNAQNNQNYYLVFRHRNSIETWSSAAHGFNVSQMTYDFTTSANQAFGNNQILLGSRYCVYNGEITGDGVIDASDMAQIENDASNFLKGYILSDLTGDEIVDGSDMSIAENNASNFIGAITP